MTTNRRMTQASRRRLASAESVRISYLAGSPGYTVRADDSIICSSVGSMYYDTPELAVRAIRRVRPDLSSADIPVTWESRPGLREEMAEPDDAERIIEDLHAIQGYAASLASDLEHDATIDTRYHLRALSLLSRLHALESDLLATPPRTNCPLLTPE